LGLGVHTYIVGVNIILDFSSRRLSWIEGSQVEVGVIKLLRQGGVDEED
jgi:hypothetical protein